MEPMAIDRKPAAQEVDRPTAGSAPKEHDRPLRREGGSSSMHTSEEGRRGSGTRWGLWSNRVAQAGEVEVAHLDRWHDHGAPGLPLSLALTRTGRPASRGC